MSTQLQQRNASFSVTLSAPISGQVIPLEQVPDPVFAEKMVGDGLSIDPVENIIRAPADGVIIQLTKTNHALTLKTDDGLDILIHIGIDTVLLKGEGFNPLIQQGDRVSEGQPLIEFDADYVAQHARALMTEIVITNGDELNTSITPTQQSMAMVGQPFMTIRFGDAAEQEVDVTEPWQCSDTIRLPNPAGLHARPAAALSALAKSYDCAIELVSGTKRANARSITALLNLGTAHGTEVHVEARGTDAALALKDIVAAINAGLGEEGVSVTETADSTVQDEPSLLFPATDDHQQMKGVAASPGQAIGVIYQQHSEEIVLPTVCNTPQAEATSLAKAIMAAEADLDALAKQGRSTDKDQQKIFIAQRELLSDPELIDQAYQGINEQCNAAHAWQRTVSEQVALLQQSEQTLLAERATDLQDVGRRVLRQLLGIKDERVELPENCILIADDLTPSETAQLDKSRVIGFVTVKGGSTSHSAILARSMNIPAIAGAPAEVRQLADGTNVILNGDDGKLTVDPEPEVITDIQASIVEQDNRRQLNRSKKDETAITRDGVQIDVVANIGDLKDAQSVNEFGGDGIGLLRSEFLFQNRTSAPCEEDQYLAYRAIAEALGPDKPLIVRTLDVGGDKPLSYLPLPHEENPFLGERGIRISLDRPALFRQQIRALLRAGEHGNIHIMFPMVADLHELQLAKQVVEEERQTLNANRLPIGIMIEVPSAAVMAEVFAPEVDFFSVGTNDLTQYTLAMDRGHPKLAPLSDALHPSILRLIHMTVEAADKHNKWVGICGGVAGDLQAVPLLIGLGVKELSASVPCLPDVKAQVRSMSLSRCQAIAQHCLQLSGAPAVRHYLAEQTSAQS